MSAPPAADLRPEDQDAISARGLVPEEIQRQAKLLRHPPGHRTLVRAAKIGDGIRELTGDEIDACLAAADHAAAAGRFLSFVPASGAASRMFQSLETTLDGDPTTDRNSLLQRSEEGETDAADALRVFDSLDEFAFKEELRDCLARSGRDLAALRSTGAAGEILHALVDENALAYPLQAKGLLPFHAYASGPRTAFTEHLEEAALYLKASDGCVKLHFTVSPHHQRAFQRCLEAARIGIRERHGASLEVSFSTQAPTTDTIALDAEGKLFRDDEDRLLFRPGGHGSLIGNLHGVSADLAFIKNIDNIVPDHRRSDIVHWRRVLGGLLVRLQEATAMQLEALLGAPEDEDLRRDARCFLADELGIPEAAEPVEILSQIVNRPMRVCGVVENTGDPGGGPFWVQDDGGSVNRQIVETAEIDQSDAQQARIAADATHFNPTDMVCALRRHDGSQFDLDQFVDHAAVFIAKKSRAGRSLLALEHPGLWNGAMAGWTTVFVAVPRSTFQPVKTILDLLGPGHLRAS